MQIKLVKIAYCERFLYSIIAIIYDKTTDGYGR